MWVIAPWVHTPKNVALGYDVGKINAGCLVFYLSVSLATLRLLVNFAVALCAVAHLWTVTAWSAGTQSLTFG